MGHDPHALFLPDSDDDEVPDVSWIHVTRAEAGRGFVYVPHLFAASDLPDLGALAELYGGGHYEVLARDASRRYVTARRSYQLGGPSRPLVAPGTHVETHAPAPVAMPVGSTPPDLHSMMMMMWQQQAESQRADRAAQAEAQRSERAAQAQQFQGFMQVLVAALTRQPPPPPNNDAAFAMVSQALSAQGALIAKVLENHGGGGGASGGAELLVQGMEIGQSIAQGAREQAIASTEAAGANDLAVIVEGVKAVASLNNHGAPAPGAPPQAKPS